MVYGMKDVKRQKGLEIAQTRKIKAISGGWLIPASSGSGVHYVRKTSTGLKCSCPDFELRNQPCKHIYAAGFYPQEPKPDQIAPSHRNTYPQDWNSYNSYQTHERELLPPLLHDLCKSIEPEPEEPQRGRPKISLRDAVFSAALKVGSNLSARRFMPEMREAVKNGFASRLPSYNYILASIEDKRLTPFIERLISLSCLPLRAVDTSFAVDATGFGSRQYYQHRFKKDERNVEKQEVIKLHACVGVKTHVITMARVTSWNVHDSKEFSNVVVPTSKMFKIAEVSEDKGYLAHEALNLVDSLGAVPYIAFKKNSRDNAESVVWNRMFHMFSLKREEFLDHYHKRSNVESVFSSLKRRYTDYVRNKGFTAQRNELLLKCLCYNISIVTQMAYELGIDPLFSVEASDKSATSPENTDDWRLV